MAKVFKGRPVVAGNCTAPALVSHGGFNTLASFQMAMMFGDKKVKCGDQNNADLYKKPMKGTALCLPQTIGSTTGGMVLYTACATNNQPACMLFSMTIDSLAASGAILADVWTDAKMPVVDELGDEFLDYVKDGMTITVAPDGTVTVELLDPKLHPTVTQYESGYANIRVYLFEDYTDEMGAAHGNFSLSREYIQNVLNESVDAQFLAG